MQVKVAYPRILGHPKDNSAGCSRLRTEHKKKKIRKIIWRNINEGT